MSARVLKLKSSYGEIFEVEEQVAVKCQTIQHIVEDGFVADGCEIPLHNVTTPILCKVIDWCKHHVHINVDHKSEVEELKQWETEFVDVDTTTLFNLLMAANYLNIGDLLDRLCQQVAFLIHGKKPEEIRKIFNIKNDFTPKEEAELYKEYAWAFD